MSGDELKQLREKRDWSQQELADLLNGALERRYGSSTVSQWETGKRKVPAAVAGFLDELQVADILPPVQPVDGAAAAAHEQQDTPPGGAEASAAVAQLPIGVSGAYTRVCTELWEMVATGVGMLGAVIGNEALLVDGQIIDADKEALGRAYGRLAETNETFRRMLVGATTSGAWLEVALVSGGTASKLWNNHLEARAVVPAPHPLEPLRPVAV